MDKWEKFWKSDENKNSLPDDFFKKNDEKYDYTEEKYEYTKSLTENAIQRNWITPTQFLCCPQKISNTPLNDYLNNLQIDKIFSNNQYGQSKIVKFGMSKDKKTIVVQTYTEGGVKNLYIAKITFENNLFVHTNGGSYFSDEGAEKYYTLALGEEWTGGEVLDDYC